MTRLDIARPVSVLSQFNSKPTPKCWQGLLRIITYFKSTVNLAWPFRAAPDGPSSVHPTLFGFSDYNWAGKLNTSRKSTSTFVFTLNGSPVLWKSSKQSRVTLSSNEAEYVALLDTSREALCLRSVLLDISLIAPGPITIHVDNKGAIDFVKLDGITPRSKHVDTPFHFSRELYKLKIISVVHSASADYLANGCTKLLGRVAFQRCCSSFFNHV